MKIILLALALIISPCYGKSSAHYIFKDKQLTCLIDAVYFESRGQPLLGQWLVGKVILNRVANGHPPTICGVVHQPSANKEKPWACHFSFTCNLENYLHKKKHLKEYAQSARIARMVKEDYVFYDFSQGAKWFKRCEIRRVWTKELTLVIKVKQHCFYRS